MLTDALARRFIDVALANVTRPYPRKLDHILHGPHEVLDPRAVHPAFYGSFDWHSAVHMHWLLARLLRCRPGLPNAGEARQVLDAHLSQAALEVELAYFRSGAGRVFERPYGWAWLLKLRAELSGSPWAQAVSPLAAELAHRLQRFADEAPYPIRSGSHGNTAFACLLALDYAVAVGDEPLVRSIRDAARRWYGADRDAPIAYEPSLDDFLSPALVEASLMQAILPTPEFETWRMAFMPTGLGPLRTPPRVADRTDLKQAHLDGLSLSRAWCMGRLGFRDAALQHLAVALPHVTGDYAGEHWLASFALLALTEADPKHP